MASVVNSFAISGVDGYLVNIETDVIGGPASINIVGLGDAAIKEAKERLQASIINSRFIFPNKKIIINLAPGDIKKSGSHFDLGMAIGLIVQSRQVTIQNLESYGFIGELSLNADLRPCSGVLPMVMEAKRIGINNIILPKENIREASLVRGINIFGFNKLSEVVDFLQGVSTYTIEDYKDEHIVRSESILDFKEVKGQDDVIEYIVAAAAGGHNILMSGTPGCGKSMIAKRFPTILPTLSEEEALEVTKIYSVAGLIKSKGDLIKERPFRSPHHNASTNSLIGGGNNAIPGEISLAHNGVLFLDEIAEFNKKTLESLRQPMEDKVVTISRVKYTHTYPANFMMVAAMNPCPCGYFGHERCKCSDYEVLKYRQKISGPILDRIDIQKYMNPVDFIDLSEFKPSLSSATLRERVEFARNIQRKRFQNIANVNCNNQMKDSHVREFCVLDNEGKEIMKKAYDVFKFSARSFNKFLKVARTFADLDGAKNIEKSHVVKALMSRDLEKEEGRMDVVS
ncbi:YifB family Mg chelatase-like AAA ATPase [uncultured Clostridium sp.]|uniref:YifB family Mg chelatase-like AAA ATPase n=1 Tax=uncultured Clostridium sp. TaxID=59620 RepID=UPI00258771BA|nr:YifB family Mg chelatase-like AAA ATPase [uncultured Clostridium sp.]MDU1348841.1 YifB family Mg chelatase-like AAA ATPase [Clostridium argentinense]